MSGAFDPQYEQREPLHCLYPLGHRSRHQCDCVCVRLRGHDGPHQCSAEATPLSLLRSGAEDLAVNAQDMLALARCCAAMLLNDHPLEWEDVPNVDQETFERLQAMVTVIAATLIEQAGTRGRGLWEATL